MIFFFQSTVENIVGIGENAANHHFLLFSEIVLKTLLRRTVKSQLSVLTENPWTLIFINKSNFQADKKRHKCCYYKLILLEENTSLHGRVDPRSDYTFCAVPSRTAMSGIGLWVTLSWLWVNPFPHNDTFWRPWETRLLKTLWEKEKLLVMSNFSFSHSVFYPFG